MSRVPNWKSTNSVYGLKDASRGPVLTTSHLLLPSLPPSSVAQPRFGDVEIDRTPYTGKMRVVDEDVGGSRVAGK